MRFGVLLTAWLLFTLAPFSFSIHLRMSKDEGKLDKPPAKHYVKGKEKSSAERMLSLLQIRSSIVSDSLSMQLKTALIGLENDIKRLENIEENDSASELGFGEHIKAISTHIIDVATTAMSVFPRGVSSGKKGSQVLFEVQDTQRITHEFVEALTKILDLRNRGDEKSLDSSQRRVLELDKSLNEDLDLIGRKVDFSQSWKRRQRHDNIKMTRKQLTIGDSATGLDGGYYRMSKNGALAEGETYKLEHDSFAVNPHEKNKLDQLASQAEKQTRLINDLNH